MLQSSKIYQIFQIWKRKAINRAAEGRKIEVVNMAEDGTQDLMQDLVSIEPLANSIMKSSYFFAQQFLDFKIILPTEFPLFLN